MFFLLGHAFKLQYTVPPVYGSVQVYVYTNTCSTAMLLLCTLLSIVIVLTFFILLRSSSIIFNPGGSVKILPRIRYMSCFDLTYAPVATAARAAATGLVSHVDHPA